MAQEFKFNNKSRKFDYIAVNFSSMSNVRGVQLFWKDQIFTV